MIALLDADVRIYFKYGISQSIYISVIATVTDCVGFPSCQEDQLLGTWESSRRAGLSKS